jgi:hypothetical protein
VMILFYNEEVMMVGKVKDSVETLRAVAHFLCKKAPFALPYRLEILCRTINYWSLFRLKMLCRIINYWLLLDMIKKASTGPMHFDITHLPQNPISTATSDPDCLSEVSRKKAGTSSTSNVGRQKPTR